MQLDMLQVLGRLVEFLGVPSDAAEKLSEVYAAVI